MEFTWCVAGDMNTSEVHRMVNLNTLEFLLGELGYLGPLNYQQFFQHYDQHRGTNSPNLCIERALSNHILCELYAAQANSNKIDIFI